MAKYQDYRNNQPLTRDGNFTDREPIKGNFTLTGMAPLVAPGVPTPPSPPEPSYEFEEGMVDAVDQDGEITRIRVTGIEGFPADSVGLKQMREYYFQSKQ